MVEGALKAEKVNATSTRSSLHHDRDRDKAMRPGTPAPDDSVYPRGGTTLDPERSKARSTYETR